MIYLTSDEHYQHGKILGYANRDFPDIQTMKHELITRHNSVVKPEDTVYHLGDFCFTQNWQDIYNILKRLNGNHHLIFGNHDHLEWYKYVEAGFTTVHSALFLDDYILIHDPSVAGVFRDRKVIHGHTHQLGINLGDNSYCVCVELHDYTPVSFDRIKSEF